MSPRAGSAALGCSLASFANSEMESSAKTNPPSDVMACPPCVSLWRDSSCEDGTLVRCAFSANMQVADEKRHKVLAVVLDRSGSMAGAMWRRVVDAVVNVVTDKLLQDPCVSIVLAVYSDQAREVRLPQHSAELRELLLSREFSPQGGTCFRAAFETTLELIKRELSRHLSNGTCSKDVDVATLFFTDGEDTSVKARARRDGVRLVDKEASSRAAREAGDAFREGLESTQCSTYTCVAAFGADHNPSQCQYMSDRYHYINRSEVLAEVLAGGLGALLSSAGQCMVRLQLPACLSLEEPQAESLALDAEGRLNHHVWLRAPSEIALDAGTVVVELTSAGVVQNGRAELGHLHVVGLGSFEAHLFRIDLVGLQLRKVAKELCGQRPSAEELAGLRARLLQVKERLQPTIEAANAVTGELRGRAALRERLVEVEALRERLSYALGHFDERDQDERNIGIVAIDAILRDAGQHVPQGSIAAELARRADSLASLPPPESLSQYGRDYTNDAYSCCDAQDLANQGDCLFFQLASIRFGDSGELVSADDSCGMISCEAFSLLSREGRQTVKFLNQEEGFTHLGIPLFAMPGHFQRVQLLLPAVLQRLSPRGIYERGVSERVLLSLLGRSLATPLKSDAAALALLHKARAVYAVLSATCSSCGGTLLDSISAEAAAFLEDACGARAGVTDADLYVMAGAGVLIERWSAAQRMSLVDAVLAECLRRRVRSALGGTSEAKRLCLAWALLGPRRDGRWLSQALTYAGAKELNLQDEGFNPFTASDELESLDVESPEEMEPREAGAKALLGIVSASGHADALPRASSWGPLRQQLRAWCSVVDGVGGLEALWKSIDCVMTHDDTEQLKVIERLVVQLRVPTLNLGLGDAFHDTEAVMGIVIPACLPNAKPERSIRRTVAEDLRTLVARRTALAREFPIIGAECPSLDVHSRERVHEVWGLPAQPVDPALHHKAHMRVSRRLMKTRVSMSMKEALADKEYRKRGGKFAFPSPLDTFIRGLHRRVADLHTDWRTRVQKSTAGEEARTEAVAEMLLRLRWADEDDRARSKLSAIVVRIWDALEGVDVSGLPPLSSALWLDDDGTAARLATDAGTASRSSPDENAAVCMAAADCQDKDPGQAGATPQAFVDAVVPAAPTGEDARAEVIAPELRLARDGKPFSHVEFIAHYGEERGAWMWDEAALRKQEIYEETAAAETAEATEAPVARECPVREAPVMDQGLQEAFDDIDAAVRNRMEAFASGWEAGSRLKLPFGLRPKQRKAVHLWAEAHGLQHSSFGWDKRRRLHLSVPGSPVVHEPTEGRGQEPDFDWAAWAEDEEDVGYNADGW